MSPVHQNRSWSPGSGIRFAPMANDSTPLYPSLDMSRFVHSVGPHSSDNSQVADHDHEYFSDDEQFEQDIIEWLDQNEALLTSPPPAEDTPHVNTEKIDIDGIEPETEQEVENETTPEILPPVTSLDYTISNELFQTALRSEKDSPESFWSYTMYRRIQEDGSVQNVKVHYCTSKHEVEYVCKKHFLEEEVIGFDLEWMIGVRGGGSVRENVSLIQIASPSRIGLFHVGVFAKDDFVAPTFRQIMESDKISKVGVNIKGDCTRLKKNLGIETKGIFELSHLYKLVKYCKTGELNRINRTCVAMSTQVQDVLRLPMYKGPSVRTGNWMATLLGPQIKYAASDAYAGVQLYYVLEHEREGLDPCPPRPEFSEKNLKIRVAPVEEIDADTEVELPNKASDITESDPSPAKKNAALSGPPKASNGTQGPDPRIATADLQVQNYCSKKGGLIAAHNAIRIYYIWHSNNNLSPESITKILPLKTNTVVTYILEAIALEKLPFSKDRLRNEVLSFLAPNAVLKDKELMAELEDLRNASK